MASKESVEEELEQLAPFERIRRIRDLLVEARELPPRERIRRIKLLEGLQREALDAARKEAEEELDDVDEFVKETEEELERALEQQREDVGIVQEEERELEARILESEIQEFDAPQYKTGTEYILPVPEKEDELYSRLQGAATQLDRLYGKTDWSREDEEIYQESKEQILKAQTYKLSQDFLEDELGLANDMLNRLQYKR